MKAVLYARVSTDEQAQEGTSIGTQRERCSASILSRGWDLVGEFVDRGVSGALAHRPELDRLMQACRAGEVDVVVVAKLDRFTRSKRHLENAVAELDDLRVAFVSVAENIDSSTPSGRMFRSLLGAFAEFEREQIAERTMSGIRATANAGLWPGGPAPFGLQLVRDGAHTRLEIHEEESQTVLLAVPMMLDHGCSTWEASKRLNAMGRLPRQAPRWQNPNLRRLLKSPHLGGVCTWDKEGQAPVTIAVPAILTPERRAALEIALEATATGPRQKNRFYMLTGRLFGICGDRFNGVYRKDRQMRQYRCRSSFPQAEDRCGDKRVNADDLEYVVCEAVRELLSAPERLLALAEDYLSLRGEHVQLERGQIESVDAKIAAANEALVQAYAVALRAGLDATALRAATSLIEQERDDLVRHRAQLEAWSSAGTVESGRMRRLWELAEVAHTRLQKMTPEEWATVLDLLHVKVTILSHATKTTPARIHIEGEVHGDLLLDHVNSGTSTAAPRPTNPYEEPAHLGMDASEAHVEHPADGNLPEGVPRRPSRKVTALGLPFGVEVQMA